MKQFLGVVNQFVCPVQSHVHACDANQIPANGFILFYLSTVFIHISKSNVPKSEEEVTLDVQKHSLQNVKYKEYGNSFNKKSTQRHL